MQQVEGRPFFVDTVPGPETPGIEGSRTMKPAHFLGLVIALAALSLLGVVVVKQYMASKELYIAICSSVDDGSGARKLTFKYDGRVYWWVGEPIVKARDMTAFRTRDETGRIAVALDLSDEDAAALGQATEANIDGQMCVAHDGEILMVATIAGKMTHTRLLVVGDSLDWEGIIAHVNGAD